MLLNNQCAENEEIEKWIRKCNCNTGSLNGILKSKYLFLKLKFGVYKTIIRPTLLYGIETWIMNRERKVLRRIIGGRRTNLGLGKRVLYIYL